MPLVDKLRAAKVKLGKPAKKEPVWQGPCGEGPNGGCTQSLLSRYIACPERFRLLTMEGWKPADRLESRMEWGSMWHACEEVLASDDPLEGYYEDDKDKWEVALHHYAQGLCKRYPLEQQQVDAMYSVIKEMFPLYVQHWAKNDQVKERTPLLQEQVFDVPFTLPSGRVVRLRGKWDAVDLIGRGKAAGVWLFETKTKSDPDERQLLRQLLFDLQTLLYLVALETWQSLDDYGNPVRFPKAVDAKIKGVRYNVIKRPRQYQGKKETKGEFLERLRGIIATSPNEFFYRWTVTVTAGDIERFKREFLVPALENLCDDYEWWADCMENGPKDGFGVWDDQVREEAFSHHRRRHYRSPFGLYNPLQEGGSTDLDELIANGSTVGLQQTTDLFPELK